MERKVSVLRVAGLAFSMAAATACSMNPSPAAAPAAPEKALTLGLVQREVHEGSSGEEVLSALGSPNQVTRDAAGREVWVYDRVSSERSETVASGSVAGAAVGTAGTVTGGAVGHASHKTTHETTSQKTLTVVIRFGTDARVIALSANATRF